MARLLDAELTARLYLELLGGRQTRLELAPNGVGCAFRHGGWRGGAATPGPAGPPRISEAEATAHASFVAELGEDAVWNWGKAAP